MADRPVASVHQILAAARAKARAARDQARREADRALASCLRYALWVREGREGRAPDCDRGLHALAEEYAQAFADGLSEWARALTLQGLPLSAGVCWELARVAAERTMH